MCAPTAMPRTRPRPRTSTARCHSDTYQRKFVADPTNTETVTNVNGETKTYVFGKVDSQGNYLIEPDYSRMPAGTTMVGLGANRPPAHQRLAPALPCHGPVAATGPSGATWANLGQPDRGPGRASVVKWRRAQLR